MKNNEHLHTFEALANKLREQKPIDNELYTKYEVKRGLRDLNGEGVVAGLTAVSDVVAKKKIDGVKVPCEGELYYRGIDVKKIIADEGITRFRFEEVAYLLLFDALPTEKELRDFNDLLVEMRKLPKNFVRDVILKAPSREIMNSLARSVLTLYSYDHHGEDISQENVLAQCLKLISVFPMFSVYAYQAHMHYNKNDSLIIHKPDPDLSIAENILRMMRQDGKFTELEAKVLDVALILHAEHGGGNNSSFTTRVVSSTGTDTYSAITAALCSLKGPRHGGANIKVMQMFEDIKHNVKKWGDEGALRDYLKKMLEGEAFDKSGLIYGMGHAVYSVSDPRADVFKGFVKSLAEEKGKCREYKLYTDVERISKELIMEKRKIYKGVSANVDFFSGFAYSMLGIPMELYTPIFAIARVAGWSAHRLEELANASKIIRPAYISLSGRREYVPVSERK
ncbi:MAG: citrate synthase [Bacillota bacterium]|nr:MAG: citrate synthase [Bacillota bacterium]